MIDLNQMVERFLKEVPTGLGAPLNAMKVRLGPSREINGLGRIFRGAVQQRKDEAEDEDKRR
jgi:hypothetical protein